MEMLRIHRRGVPVAAVCALILLGAVALGWATEARSAQAPQQGPLYFLATLEARPTFLTDATPAEGQTMQQHVAYLGSLFKSGKLVVGGRCADAPFAVLVLEAASKEEAERIAGDDPGVRAGIFKPQVRPFLLVFQRK